jgi:hypothetical protein
MIALTNLAHDTYLVSQQLLSLFTKYLKVPEPEELEDVVALFPQN